MTDADGLPLVVRTGAANQPDAVLASEMLDAIPPCGGQRGRPRRRPKVVPGDGAYGIEAIIAAVVPRRVRSLKLGYERFGEHFQAFHELAACLIGANRIEKLGLSD